MFYCQYAIVKSYNHNWSNTENNMAKTTLIIPEITMPRKVTMQEYTYQRLRHSLMVGCIEPGIALTIRGLAASMGVSPTPVREAIRRLSSQNALTILENRRCMVPLMTKQRFTELIKFRAATETFAAERALPFVSDILIDNLEQLDLEMDQTVIKHDREKLILQNQLFHTKLYQANPDQMSMPTIESIWLQLGPFLKIALQHVSSFYAVDRHKEIISALRARNLVDLKLAISADIHDAVGKLDNAALIKILAS